MAIIGGDQGKAGESKGSGRKADDLRLSCLCLLLQTSTDLYQTSPDHHQTSTDLTRSSPDLISGYLEKGSFKSYQNKKKRKLSSLSTTNIHLVTTKYHQPTPIIPPSHETIQKGMINLVFIKKVLEALFH